MKIRLSQGPRLNARTTDRIHRATLILKNKMCQDGVVFDERILTTEALVSCVLKAFLDIEYEDQLALIKAVVPDLERECENGGGN